MVAASGGDTEQSVDVAAIVVVSVMVLVSGGPGPQAGHHTVAPPPTPQNYLRTTRHAIQIQPDRAVQGHPGAALERGVDVDGGRRAAVGRVDDVAGCAADHPGDDGGVRARRAADQGGLPPHGRPAAPLNHPAQVEHDHPPRRVGKFIARSCLTRQPRAPPRGRSPAVPRRSPDRPTTARQTPANAAPRPGPAR